MLATAVGFAAADSVLKIVAAAAGAAAVRSFATSTSRESGKAAKPKIVRSSIPIIHWNLAYEMTVLEHFRPTAPTLLTWSNGPTIVIGHNQNPWKECDLAKMDANGVELARRHSGGGAVYQDFGNTVFSFIYPEGTSNVTRNNNVILRALESKYGIQGEATGRNDLTVDGRKFSGVAFKKNGDHWIHHGTLLRDVDMGGLNTYLTPNSKKLQSKGVSSVAARVVNLATLNSTIDHEGLCDALEAEFIREFAKNASADEVEREELTKDSPITKHKEFKQTLFNLLDPKWRFGATPAFSHLMEKWFPWGNAELHIDTRRGKISDVKLYTDSLIVNLPEVVRGTLMGKDYGNCWEELHAAAEREQNEPLKEQLQSVADLLKDEITSAAVSEEL